jgi:hypothetical protein
MSLGELQACLARLYIDEPFRRLFYIDPLKTLEEYRLTEEEYIAVSSIDRDKLNFFAVSLKNKRKTRIQQAYPFLFALDEREIDHYYARFYQLYTAKPHQSGYQDVIDFGKFIEESLTDSLSLPRYASDLVRYERLYYCAMRLRRQGGDDETLDSNAGGKPIMVSASARPSLRSGVVLAQFDYQVAEIEDALQRGEQPDDLELKSECFIVFKPPTNISDVKLVRLNLASKTVVAFCDASRTVSEIVSGVEATLGVGGLNDSVVDAITRLLKSRILVLDAGTAATSIKQPRSYGVAYNEAM